MDVQLEPAVSQRRHWWAYEVGDPDHEPASDVNVCPTAGVPESAGSTVLVGAETAGRTVLLGAAAPEAVVVVVVPAANGAVGAEPAYVVPILFDAVTVKRNVD